MLKLKEARKRTGLSMRAFCEEAGISTRTLQDVEREVNPRRIRRETAVKVAPVLARRGIDPTDVEEVAEVLLVQTSRPETTLEKFFSANRVGGRGGGVAELQGFWSYVHADNDTDGGRVSRLARDLAAQFEMLTGEKIRLFLDRDDIDWGEDWRGKIDESLASIAFFIPVLTPRYFMSPECRRELQFFAQRARNLGVDELVLPLLYVDVPSLHEDAPSDDLVALVKTFQWKDWSDLRFSDVNSSEYRQGVAELAQRLVEANKKAEEKDIAAAARELEAPVEDAEDDSPGLLERLAAAEETLPQWQATLEGISREIELIGPLMNDATADIERANAQGKGFAARLTIARRLSKRLHEPAENIWSLGNKSVSQLHQIDPGFRAIIEQASIEAHNDPESKANVCSFFQTIRELSDSARGGLESIQSMIDAISPLEAMSRDLRNPLRRLRQGLTLMVEARKVTDDWVEMIEGTDVDCGSEPPATDLDDLGTLTADPNGGEARSGSGTKKHTVLVGQKDGTVGETVSFASDLLGTAKVNGGFEGGGLDYTFYRLPDGNFRVLVEGENIAMLVPSNMDDAISKGERNNFSYGRMTLEEMKAHPYNFGKAYEALMETHPETVRNRVRDID